MDETSEQEIARLRKLEAVVKGVLSQEDDDHCWRDVYTEMAELVGVEWKPKVIDKPTMLRNCERFVDCLLSGEHYVTPTVPREVVDRIARAYIHKNPRPDCLPSYRFRAVIPPGKEYWCSTEEEGRRRILEAAGIEPGEVA